jgi:hypothetical protein
MGRRRGLKRMALLGLGFTAACVTPNQIAIDRLSEEYHCPPNNITVTPLAGNAFRADGCGYTATYDCTVVKDSGTTCVKEAGASPVPVVPPPPGLPPPGPPPPPPGAK